VISSLKGFNTLILEDNFSPAPKESFMILSWSH